MKKIRNALGIAAVLTLSLLVLTDMHWQDRALMGYAFSLFVGVLVYLCWIERRRRK